MCKIIFSCRRSAKGWAGEKISAISGHAIGGRRACHAGPYKQMIQANKKKHPAGGPKFLSGLPRPGVFFVFPFQVGALCGALTLWGLRQYRIILSADTASEVRQMLTQKRRQYFVLQR